jgi:hypothetical protein
MKQQVQITPEVIANWQEEAIGQLASGWKVSDVRRQLVRSGCTPQVLEQILRKAQGGVRKGNRRIGRVTLVFGVLLVVAGIGIVIVQAMLANATGARSIAVPTGLILVGLVSILTGVLKAIFG